MNETPVEDYAALLVSSAVATAQKEFIMDSLPSYCFCGLADADRIRKWTLCLRRQLDSTTREANPRQDAIQRVLLKSLETALQQHLSICFQMKDEDDLVFDYCGLPGTSRQFSEDNNVEFPPISVNLEIPDYLVHNCHMNYQFSDPVLNDDGTTWNTRMHLQFIPPNETVTPIHKEDKAVQVEETELGLLPTCVPNNTRLTLPPRVSHLLRQRQSLLAALDLRRKNQSHKLIFPQGYDVESHAQDPDEPDWEHLERLEIEILDDLKNLTPLQRQTSFYNYMKILNNSLTNYKNELDKWDRIARSHFDLVKGSMSKEKLEEMVQYRLLRQDIRQEIAFLEEQIQHRAVVIEKDADGNERTKPLVDRNTSRERFAKSTRVIAEMIEVLKEQIQSQINQYSTHNGTNLSTLAEQFI